MSYKKSPDTTSNWDVFKSAIFNLFSLRKFSIVTHCHCEESKTQAPSSLSSIKNFLQGSSKFADGEEVDLYRDTPVRLLGYANEVGEAFRPIISVWLVRASYVISSGYVVADTLDKSTNVSKVNWSTEEERSSEVRKAIADTLIWQSFASVIIPGFTINRTCYMTLGLMNKAARVPQFVRNWTTVFICLSLIPFIVKPIDHFVDYVMDVSLRKYLVRKTPPSV